MAAIMTARYAGRCIGCGGEILPGMTIRHEGRKRSFHAEAADCGIDDYSNINPVTGDRMSNSASVVVTEFSSGARVTRNSNGRCEDAPCCGCCT